MISNAVLSADGKYRYSLTREWGQYRRMLFVMLNPSTADAEVDDPTIRRCIGFAEREQCDSIEVVNLYAYRARDPMELKQQLDPEGPLNPRHVIEAQNRAEVIVAAWGAQARFHLSRHYRRQLSDPYVFGLTKFGFPRHPLYVKADAPLVRWSEVEARAGGI